MNITFVKIDEMKTNVCVCICVSWTAKNNIMKINRKTNTYYHELVITQWCIHIWKDEYDSFFDYKQPKNKKCQNLILRAMLLTLLPLLLLLLLVLLLLLLLLFKFFFLTNSSALLISSNVTPCVERLVSRTLFAWALRCVSLSSSRTGGTNDLIIWKWIKIKTI